MQNEELHRAKTVAQELSDKYFDLFDFAPTGFFLLDECGKILEVNLSGAALLAQDRNVVVARQFAQFVAMEDRTEFAEFRRQVLQADAKQCGEFKLVKGEHTIDVLVEAIAFVSNKKELQRLRLVVTDITVQKQAERTARMRQNSITLWCKGPTSALRLSTRRCNIVTANRKQAEIVGKSQDELVGMKCFREYEGLDVACPQCPGLKAMTSRTTAECERSGKRKDGTPFTVHVKASPMYDQSGKPRGFIEIVQDVTERKRGEDALAAAARDLSIVFNSMTDGMSVHGPDHTIIDVNQSLCHMLGKTREEMIGKKCYQVFHGTNVPIAGCPLEISKATCRKE